LLWVAGVETSGSVGRRFARIALVAQMGQCHLDQARRSLRGILDTYWC